ncbi:MAG: M20/M25/M40 family metallo-hydrolase [candidate division NC10 bacterium]|jgi:tripeptide aminopeptidase
MIHRDRMREHFLTLVQIDSPPRKEREAAMQLKEELIRLGAEVRFDQADREVGGTVGNLIGRIPETRRGAAPFLLCAHMDTVASNEGIKPQVEENIIRSDGSTILGADDKSGIAIICEVLRVLQEEGIPHPEIEIIFTICEEIGLQGARHLDVSRLHARTGLVLDSSNPDHLITRAPTANRLQFTVRGLEAHAGVSPEKGINAIRIASEAIAGMRLGRLDEETTANIGIIEGGGAINIIPNTVTVQGETRSHDEGKLKAQTEHMIRCFEEAAARHRLDLDGVTHRGQVTCHVQRDYDRLFIPEEARIVQLVREAARALGREITLWRTGGASDANILCAKGLEVANVGTGQQEVHTVRERLLLDDMVKSAELVLETLKLHADGI